MVCMQENQMGFTKKVGLHHGMVPVGKDHTVVIRIRKGTTGETCIRERTEDHGQIRSQQKEWRAWRPAALH